MQTVITAVLAESTTFLTGLITDNFVTVVTLVASVGIVIAIASYVKRAPARIFGGH